MAQLGGSRPRGPEEIDWDDDMENRQSKQQNAERIIGPMRSLMSQLDQALLHTKSHLLQAALDRACQKLDIETRQLLRNTQRNLLDLEESLASVSARSPGKPAVLLALLSTFLDREAWLVNATVHSLMHSCTDLVVFLPRNARVKTESLLGKMANVADQLMEPVQDELERLRQAAGQPDPCAEQQHVGELRHNDTVANVMLPGSISSFATSLKGEFKLASRREAERRLARLEEEGRPSGMSSPFMKLAEEIIVAGVQVMDTLQLTFQRLMEEVALRDDGCEDAFIADDPEQEALAEQRAYSGSVDRLWLPRQTLFAATCVALSL